MKIIKGLKLEYLYFFIFTALITYSCSKDGSNEEKPDNDTIMVPNHEDKDDYSWEESSVNVIAFNINIINSTSSSVTIAGKKATITKAGNYRLEGELNDGQLIVDAPDDARVRLILKNCRIQNNSGPAVLIKRSLKTIIFLEDQTKNKLSDWPSYSDPDDEPNAALFSKSDLTIFGNGELEVFGQYKDGITSKDGLLIKSGSIKVQTVDDGIRGKDNLTIEDGTIMISSGGDGIKSDNEGTEGTGIVFIDGGRIHISASGDGILASTQFTSNGGILKIITGGGNTSDTSSLSQKGIKAGSKVMLALDSCDIDAADHAIDSDDMIEIQSGNYMLKTARAAIHSNNQAIIHNGIINISRAMEGCESKIIRINGGELHVFSIDDGLSGTDGYDVEVNDGSLIEFNGGYSVFRTMHGDGIDSNGDIFVNNGTVIIHGPADAPEVGVDCNNIFNISGGLLLASGTNSDLFNYPDSTSTQNSLVFFFESKQTASTLFHLSDQQGKPIITFQPSNQFQSVIFSSPSLTSGSSYSVYLNGSVSGDLPDGAGTDNAYLSGNLLSTFQLTDKLTILRNLSTDIEP
ncbi:MAG TPA: carbohydrate-binding domain-containing protein [Lentimicrobium sp.]|nr:carbohydrate-binding domain-containing protein [Lentimicrobium sp.]